MSDSKTPTSWIVKVREWFPDREFFMRSQGQVRFIKISSRLQMGAAGAALALTMGWAGSMGVMAWNNYQAETSLASFQQERAEVAEAQDRLEAYSGDLEATIGDLDARQDALDQMLEMLPPEIRDIDTNVTDSGEETAELIEQVGRLYPQVRGLAEIEARQLAFVESLTRYADWRARRAEAALRQLNLDPGAMAAATGADLNSGMGGPLEVLASAADGSLDPRFERLGMSLQRMAQLEQFLDGVPQVVPTLDGRVTSPYGFRRDPFTGRAAMHNGIDYGGPVGAPILAAAGGEVVFVGWKGGYGWTVDVDHGGGMLTRYAHLSRFDVAVGDRVEAGETIAGLGNSGRSTGPHLHFEVRFNGRAINPRPFLETAPDVLEEARTARATRVSARRSSSQTAG